MAWPGSDNDGLDALQALPTARRTQSPSCVDSEALSHAELRYLQAVMQHAGQSSSAYPKLAGFGQRRGQGIRRRLVELGYLREHRVDTGGRGRASILLELLEPAHRALREASEGLAKDDQ